LPEALLTGLGGKGLIPKRDISAGRPVPGKKGRQKQNLPLMISLEKREKER